MFKNDNYTIIDIKVPTLTTIPLNLGNITKYRISKNGYIRRDPIVNREVYSALGLWDTNSYNTDDGIGISDSKAIGYISENDYYNKINNLINKLAPRGVNVYISEYRVNTITENEIEVDGFNVVKGFLNLPLETKHG